MTAEHTVLRCAIYCRKSSEEGLEQSFNSLDAQREACEAYIASQRQEGWRALPARYDDGGYSGGNMDRPALKQLLADIENNKVNVIVVYKVDRLTRSLADFAKIVEAFDSKGVSFVSVTQQFNTTTSMGRLTLNVLLSFAQFEREVTGERIRDKIAASKRKGIWMGGPVPLGYDLEARKLLPNAKEVDLVCKVFSLYLEMGCVSKLAARLDRENLKSKVWITRAGARRGGSSFARGALYGLLRNRLYVGEIRHHDRWHAGEHQGIVPRELWDKVQDRLCSDLRTHRNRAQNQSSSLLTGLIEDASGNRFTPSFTLKNGRRYRYYVSQAVIKNPSEQHSGPTRLPAHELETRVMERLHSFLNSDADVFDALGSAEESPATIRRLLDSAKKLVSGWALLRSNEIRDVLASFIDRVVVHDMTIRILLSRTGLCQMLEKGANFIPISLKSTRRPVDAHDLLCLTIEAKRKRCGGEVHLVVPPNSSATLSARNPKLSLVKAVARAHAWHEKVLEGKAVDLRSLARMAGLTERYVGKVFGCAFLAPDIVEAILEGRQPHDLNFDQLGKGIPLSWVEQRRQFGFLEKSSRR